MRFRNFLVLASIVTCWALTVPATAQEIGGQDIVIGKSYKLQSEILGRDINLMVSLPDGYEGTTKDYPVFYLLEGNWYFSYMVDLMNRVSVPDQDHLPPAILVATDFAENERWATLADDDGGPSGFMEALEKELIPFVESTFKASQNRVLLGWQFGGSFALHTLSARPNLFDAYIVASPYPVNEKNSDFSTLQEMYSTGKVSQKYLYVSAATNEDEVTTSVSKLAKRLEASNSKALAWDHKIRPGDTIEVGHITTPYPVFRAGLNHFYADYRPLWPESVEEYGNIGGIDFVRAFYQNRGEKYGLPTSVSRHTIWKLMRVALEAENFEMFEEVRTEANLFDGEWGDYWLGSFANFMVQNGKVGQAILIYEHAFELYPNSLRILVGYGDAQVAFGEKEAAKLLYQRAINIAKAQSHPRTGDIITKLEGL